VAAVRGKDGRHVGETKIRILPDILASQVAAGEVVERPASVVKELVENSIDAGARQIEVEIRRGGVALVKVTDNGCGMSREDALMSLERHATSKLRDSNGLQEIRTLGFRGEAIPSIASVSRFRLASREAEAVEGVEIEVDGGHVRQVRGAGMSPGTCIEVNELFFNVPARRKFLKSEATEAAQIDHQLRLHALSSPSVRFTFRKDGRVAFDLPAVTDRRVRIAGLIGSDSGGRLIEVPAFVATELSVSGYILPASHARRGRQHQCLFLNGRPIEDPAISRAMRDAFRGELADGLHPAAWLWLEIDPAAADVNVHPAKREVRFRNPLAVREAVRLALTHALRADALPPVTPATASPGILEHPWNPVPAAAAELAMPAFVPQGRPLGASVQREFATPAAPNGLATAGVFAERKPPTFRLLGVVQRRYAVLEGDEGLVLMDPRACRERIIYERLLAGAARGGLEVQGLLVPLLLDLDPRDAELIRRHAANFAEAGIEVGSFGGTTVQVRSLPALLNLKDPRAFLLDIVDELRATQESRRGRDMAFETFAAKLARQAGRAEACGPEQLEALLADLFGCDLPYCTADGRPTLVQLSINEIERKFGR
jgi:DNA mismatch repair protein MutL